ncbi:PREDICTED: protein PET117 homolog, mitochondrial [Diuraphis noxia]|uniref:protein PET117 homolog, mitochondrial n=1 Tax=Diuraphis noxia TaxID=143948 RepID=UPI0007639F92|nr:PREDICTED: protein PET117 homolog, mitochondrial [Diuraphis noxia]
MSTTSKIVFGLSCFTSVGIIGFVHYQQQDDLNKLHEGVVKDIERQENKRRELEINSDILVANNLQNGEKIA